MSASLKGPWTREQIDAFLIAAHWPLRLACQGSDGFPRVVSVWFRLHQGRLESVSHRDSALVRLLKQDPRVGFEVSPNQPPYHGVRGQGRVTLQPLGSADTLEQLVERYLGDRESRVGNWLLSRKPEEVLITLTPERLFSWDYRDRMADVAAR